MFTLIFLTCTVALVSVYGVRQLMERVAEAISNFRRPGPPNHPLPADDSKILNRRARRRARISG